MWLSRQDDRTQREKDLEYEVERLRDDERRRREKEDRDRQARQQEMKDWREEHLRSADSWPEALDKQAFLFGREARDDLDDHFFALSAEACREARRLWNQVSDERHAEIDDLQKKLAAIQDEIRLAVADRLEAAKPDVSPYVEVADAIRTGDYNNWLYW